MAQKEHISGKAAIVVLFLVVAAGLLFVSKPWAAQGTDKAPVAASEGAPGTPWALRCDEIKDKEKVTGKYCEMVQSLSLTKTEGDASTTQRLLEVAIGYPPGKDGKANAVMILPLGILVTEAVVVEIDGSKEKKGPVRYCEMAGCVVVLELGAKDMKKLEKGSIMTVKTQTAMGQPVAIEVSLLGFANAHKQIKPQKTGGFFD